MLLILPRRKKVLFLSDVVALDKIVKRFYLDITS